jgi:5-methylcytosine-specific restriction endonuclease McrA
MCLVCGIVTDQSRCKRHRTKQARGYGAQHENSKKVAMQLAPYCWKCFCPATTCKLEWHHVTELRGGRNPEKDNRRQLLCRQCHNNVKE